MTVCTPVSATLTLPMAPQLASWDAATSTSQARLAEYLAAAEQLLRPQLDNTPDPLGLHLVVGLPRDVPLLQHRDLDNYLQPLVQHLARATGRTFASVTAVKEHRTDSRIGAGPAHRADPVAAPLYRVRTTGSTESVKYKEQISAALAAAPLLPPGPVQLDVVFGVGPARTWVNLWKPTIDALGALLGQPPNARPWHPDDGRITRLGLHQRQDDTLGYDVELLIIAAPLAASPNRPPTAWERHACRR